MLVWMCVIFGASSDQGSFQHSSHIVAPILLWLFPGLSDGTVHTIVVCVRKCAHLTEYAVLAWLIWRPLNARGPGEGREWRWSRAVLALLLAALYAASDEYHQTYVPSRQGSVADVALDTCGAAAGLAARYGLHRLVGEKKLAHGSSRVAA